ncbi:hypothetical protein EVAR_32127_1 [Eumeta japonica]|uniref:Uncharacterized protein n=1 Tax=Eumeta variegata TaxID=151549 RepID=A0A4C1V4W5_EUMVA|nr:hypothetical protein EVAR_32127_1 [Eumeta japonica]
MVVRISQCALGHGGNLKVLSKIMSGCKPLLEDEILSLLNEEQETADDGTDSELKDHVSDDDVQSDLEDEFIDEAPIDDFNES